MNSTNAAATVISADEDATARLARAQEKARVAGLKAQYSDIPRTDEGLGADAGVQSVLGVVRRSVENETKGGETKENDQDNSHIVSPSTFSSRLGPKMRKIPSRDDPVDDGSFTQYPIPEELDMQDETYQNPYFSDQGNNADRLRRNAHLGTLDVSRKGRTASFESMAKSPHFTPTPAEVAANVAIRRRRENERLLRSNDIDVQSKKDVFDGISPEDVKVDDAVMNVPASIRNNALLSAKESEAASLKGLCVCFYIFI